MNEWMNDVNEWCEWMVILFPCDQKLAESQFSRTHVRQLKEDNERTKTTESVNAVQLKSSGQSGR